MAVPLDAIRAIHNAFRKDMKVIDDEANSAARGQGSPDLIFKRYTFFNEVLVWHAIGEEESVFPAIENVAPLITYPYEQDHRGLDSLNINLNEAVNAGDVIETARITASLSFHLNIHLNKEDSHLYRIFNERISLPDQGTIVGEMARKIPQDRFPDTVSWLFPLLNLNDRENMTMIWRQLLPPANFAAVANLIHTAIGKDWGELVTRVPELESLKQSPT